MKTPIGAILLICFSLAAAAAEEKVEVETSRIKANKELPNVLYVVPWKEMEDSKNTEQKLVLHDFFGDLYDPVLPSNSATEVERAPEEKQ